MQSGTLVRRSKILTRVPINKFRTSHVKVEYALQVPKDLHVVETETCSHCTGVAMYHVRPHNDDNHNGTIVIECAEGFYCADCIDIFYKKYCGPNWAIDDTLGSTRFQSYLLTYL